MATASIEQRPAHLDFQLQRMELIYCHQSANFDESQTDVEHTGICMLRD